MAVGGETLLRGSSSYFAVEMKKLMGDRESSDVKFLVGAGRKQFHAHRCILSVRCDAFRSMLTEARASVGVNGRRPSTAESVASTTTENQPHQQQPQLILAETNPEAFAAVLEFVYTNCVTLRPQTALQVLACAVEYRLEDLKRLCCEYLTDSLSAQNACELLQAGSSFGLPELRQRAGDFIERNAAAVVKSRGFSGLSSETLAALLASDQLMLDELEVVAAVRDWAASGGSARTIEETRAPVRQLRLGLLSPQELAEVEAENEREFRLIPIEMLAEAWKLHALHQYSSDATSLLARPRKGTIRRTAGVNSCRCKTPGPPPVKN